MAKLFKGLNLEFDYNNF